MCAVQNAARRAVRFDPGDNVMARRSGQELLERLALLNLKPDSILDLGCGAGIEASLLRQQYPDALIFGLDFCYTQLMAGASGQGGKAAVGNAGDLPFRESVFDLVLCNLVLPWCDVEPVLQEIARVLRPGGALMVATFGPDTLSEVQRAWQDVDDCLHVHGFADMHDLGDALIHAGFTEPVMDVQMLGLTYSYLEALVSDLRAMGGTNALSERRRTLTGKNRWRAFTQAYPLVEADGGRFRATFELIYGVAWAKSETTVENASLRVSFLDSP